MNRNIVAAAVLASTFALAAAAEGPPPAKPAGAPPAAAGKAPPTPPGQPKAFKDVIKEAKEIPGYFNLYQHEDKVWIELKPEQLDTPYYLSINRTRGLGEGSIGLFPFMARGYRERRWRWPRGRASPTACSRALRW